MASWRARFVLVLALLAAASCRKGDEETVPASPPMDEAKARPLDETPLTAEQRQRADEILALAEASGQGGVDAQAELALALRSLDDKAATAIGRNLAQDARPAARRVGASLLVERGDVDGAVPVAANLIADDDPFATALGYRFEHAGDEMPVAALRLGILRHLVAHLDEFQGQRRTAVDRYLVAGLGLAPPVDAAKARAALADFEARQKATGPQ